MQNFGNYDISVPNYLSNCVAKIGQQWKISLLIVFTSCSILRPRSARQAHLPLRASIFLLTFFAHSCLSLTPARTCDLVIMTARGLHVAVPILCGRPRCGHRACHLAARWRCGLGARASCSLCSAHLLSTTFPVCPLPRHRAPPVYLYPVPQVDSRACDGKAVTSRKTSWTAETAPGYHHHHHPHPCLPRDCELAESLLNSDPSSPPWPKNHSQTIQ